MINHPNRGRYTQVEIREYLADRYSAEAVKNGAEASKDEAGLYYGEEDSWLVFGTIPNTNQDGWFFAGNTRDIVRDMRDDA